MMSLAETIDVQDLPDYLRRPTMVSSKTSPGSIPSTAPDSNTFEDHEKRLIAEALERANWNQSEAARVLSIGRDALRYKMKKHGLEARAARQ
jgi:DNA-binding NtrC family response regulator